MSICTSLTQSNLRLIIINYVGLLLKSENLHDKLEKLYTKVKSNTSKLLMNQILKINLALNKIMVQLMEYKWAIEYLIAYVA